jgi:hypothetical protein
VCGAYSVGVFNLARPEHVARIRDDLNLAAGDRTDDGGRAERVQASRDMV